jgi:hypothetical protein
MYTGKNMSAVPGDITRKGEGKSGKKRKMTTEV